MDPLIALGALGAALLAYVAAGRGGARRTSPRSPDPEPGGGDESGPALRDPIADAFRAPETIATRDPAPDPALHGGLVAPPKMQEWATMLAPGCARAGIPLPYALRWIDMESGGNPCEVGIPNARAPDGFPREMGIAQLYNPDDLVLIDPPLTGTELRAYCVPGDQHEVVYRGRKMRGFSSSLLRPLFPQEMRRQADGSLALIRRSMRSASSDLAGVGAGSYPAWSAGGKDYWTLVKLQHGLPAFSREGMPAAKKLLGHAPRDWPEFKAALARVRLSKGAEAKRGDLAGALDNAQRCASVIPTETGAVA